MEINGHKPLGGGVYACETQPTLGEKQAKAGIVPFIKL